MKDVSSDTPMIYLGGPMNRHVEDWGTTSPRGLYTTFYRDGEYHDYSYFFFRGPAKDKVDDGVVECVLAYYEGARAVGNLR